MANIRKSNFTGDDRQNLDSQPQGPKPDEPLAGPNYSPPTKRAGREGGDELGRSLLVLQLVRQPVEALVQTVAAGGTGRLDVPVSLTQGMQAQFVCDFGCIHGVWKVLKRESQFRACVTLYTLQIATQNVKTYTNVLDIIQYNCILYRPPSKVQKNGVEHL